MRDCENPREGIVTNQPGTYDPNRNHYAVSVCGSNGCRMVALGDTLLATGEPGHYIPDPHDVPRWHKPTIQTSKVIE